MKAGSELVLASGNAGKIREMAQLLGDLGLSLRAQGDLGIDDTEETGLTFVENALIKARHASQASGLPALADDSGLVVDALNGAPGLYSARYAGEPVDHQRNIQQLLGELAEVSPAQRTARFLCVIVLLRHHLDPDPLIATGRWDGLILDAPRGAGGFGYDPIFQPRRLSVSAAELDAERKNQLSHRGQALKVLRQGLLAVDVTRDEC